LRDSSWLELVQGFSKRTDRIDTEVDRLIEEGRERTPRLVKWAVHATRKPKVHEAPDTLYDRWRQEASERGHDPDTLVREVTGRIPNRDQDRALSAEVAGRLFDRLAGPDGLTATASTFTRPDVLVALGAGLAGAGRTELEELADRFLAERAVSVVADRALEERRWSTPDLLAVEQRLVVGATGRTEEHTAVASHQGVRDALAAHPTAGTDQQAMVRDMCQGGQGVALVVGRAGTGKTFALGIARHAWQLDGYRLLASAPTGIATMSLQGEGFEDVATGDRLLADFDRGREQLDARTVLVVDEAGMVGSRKLGRLLEHTQRGQAKVVLVGDDRHAVVGPEPQGTGELDLPDREQPDGYLQLAQALSRAGGQTLAIDTHSSPDLQRLSTAELRTERDRLRHQLDQAPRDRSRELARATHRQQAEAALAAYHQPSGRQRVGMLGWLRRGGDQLTTQVPGGPAVAHPTGRPGP
jgi:AAA domain/TrwC relaxase